MSTILKRPAGLARVASRALDASSRTSLRTPRFLRTTPAAWSAQSSRCYSANKPPPPSPPPPNPENENKKPQNARHAGDKPRVKSTRSPGPTEAGAKDSSARKQDEADEADDRFPLPEGWVYLNEEQFDRIRAMIERGPFKIPLDGLETFESIRRTGVPQALADFLEKDNVGIADAVKVIKSLNSLAWHIAQLENQGKLNKTEEKRSSRPSRPSRSYQESSKSSNESEGKQGRREEEPHDEKQSSKSSKKGFQSNPAPKAGGGTSFNTPKGNDWWITILAAIVTYYLYSSVGESGREITWQELRKNFLDKGLVEKMVVAGHKVIVELNRDATQSMYPESAATRPGFNFYFSIASVEAFERRLEEAQNELGIPSSDRIPVSYAGESNFMNLLLAFGPTVLLVGLLVYASRRGPGGGGSSGLFGFSKSKAKRFSHETAIKVKFSDVAGLDEAKQEIMEFVSFLKKPERFQRLGAKIPRGAILAGPPGTGKTLLAKATAGESGVPFFSVSGSEFVEMFVGVGASRVRDLFATARQNAPCIVFIDEIDAIGRARSEGQRFGGNDEREATLNQILTEMDGFNTSEQIVVLAGTNRVDILDKALMRPGRFDRHINIDAPTMAGRQDIFKVYLKKIVTNEDMEYLSGRLASLTPGFAGADIANCVNEAALIGKFSAVST